MLTEEENVRLTQVGPGTPGGELLRRYWYPVAVGQDLTPERPTKFVRLLGEDLVLFRDKSGRVGLLADHCSHRSASLVYGRVEERGIACAYHGWLYDCEGNILETPPERNDAIMRSVKQTAYPVEQFCGMYWAYLGPQPVPVIPHIDVWVRTDGVRTLITHPPMDCNYFQAMENSVDPAHLQILHQDSVGRRRRPINTTRGYTDDVQGFEFYKVPYGIMKKRTYVNGFADEHPLVFPNILRTQNGTEIRVPVDDYRTVIFQVDFDQTEDGSEVEEGSELPVVDPGPYKDPPDRLHPFARIFMDTIPQQDQGIWETQGRLVDRTVEHLSYSDRGVVLLRRLMFEQQQVVQDGGDPLGVERNPDHEVIDTNLQAVLDRMRTGTYGPTGINTPTYVVDAPVS